MRTTLRVVMLSVTSLISFLYSSAQGPGYIIRQAGTTNLGSSGTGVFSAVTSTTGQTILNPDNNGAGTNPTNYATKSTYTGQWTPSDDVTNSEIPYAAIPPYSSEPYADLRRGPAHLYSDFVPSGRTTDLGASYYMYFRGSATALDSALCFRLRMGSIMPGAKGFSILMDADGKFGATGPNADPNYIAATTGTNGNPGFELEVDLFTQTSGQTGIALYNVDGTSSPVLIWSANDYTQYSQIVIAGTNDNGDPDFYLDFFVPWNKISKAGLGITTSTNLRFIPTTVMAPQAAIGGPKSDIYGLNDNSYPNANVEYETLLSAMPGFSISQLSSTTAGSIPNSGNTQLCTAAPTIAGVTTTGGSGFGQVTGNWNKLSISTQTTATITVYKLTAAGVQSTLGTVTGVTSASSGVNWTYNIPSTLNNGDKIWAQAQSTGENACQTSNTILIQTCTTPTPSGAMFTCASDRGLEGTRTSTTQIVKLYKATTSGLTLFATDGTTAGGGASPSGYTITYSGYAWVYQGQNSNNNGTACSGSQSDIPAGSYVFTVTETGSCESIPISASASAVSPCISTNGAGNSYTVTATPTITTPVYNSNTSIIGTKATGSTAFVYKQGGILIGSDATSGTTWSINATPSVGDSLFVYDINGTTGCLSTVTTAKVATCVSNAPYISVNSSTGYLTTGSPITGTGVAGATINVYSGTTLLATTTVNTSGQWTTSGATYSNGFTGNAVINTTYYATATTGTCTVSANSTSASTANGTTSGRCGSITTTNITTSTTSISGTLVSSATSTTVNLYEDGYLIGTQSGITSTGSWTIAVSNLYSGDGYTTGKLTIGIQESGKDEQICDTSTVKAFVTCTRPVAASLSFVSCTNCGGTASTLQSGGTVTYKVGDATNPAVIGTFYSLRNPNTGQSLSTGVWATATSFNITTNPVTSTGTYAVELAESSVTSSAVCSGTGTSTQSYVVLPVQLITFTGTHVGASNVLSWKTATEVNTIYFEIERSTDGVSFYKIGVRNAKGDNSTYDFTDASLTSLVNYYRLRIVDADGRKGYSRVIVLRENGSSTVLNAVRPNPFQNTITVSVLLNQSQKVSVALIDASGRQVATKEIAGNNGLNEISLGGLSALSPGVYTIKVVCNGASLYEKVLKTN